MSGRMNVEIGSVWLIDQGRQLLFFLSGFSTSTPLSTAAFFFSGRQYSKTPNYTLLSLFVQYIIQKFLIWKQVFLL